MNSEFACGLLISQKLKTKASFSGKVCHIILGNKKEESLGHIYGSS